MRARSLINGLIFSTICLFSFCHEAHAYLDPGTGSIIIQSLIGAIFAAFFFLKTYWGKITTFFGKKAADGAKSDPH